MQWNKYFHSVKDDMYHSVRLCLVKWNISSFTTWKYLYHCTHKHSLFVYYAIFCLKFIPCLFGATTKGNSGNFFSTPSSKKKSVGKCIQRMQVKRRNKNILKTDTWCNCATDTKWFLMYLPIIINFLFVWFLVDRYKDIVSQVKEISIFGSVLRWESLNYHDHFGICFSAYRIVSNKRSPSNKRPLTYFQIKLGKMPKFLYGVSL